jgi:hypothetical protein
MNWRVYYIIRISEAVIMWFFWADMRTAVCWCYRLVYTIVVETLCHSVSFDFFDHMLAKLH